MKAVHVPLLVLRTENPAISLVFREIWNNSDADRSVHRVNRESEGKNRGIPHLAKNERDKGHPSLVGERESTFGVRAIGGGRTA